MNNKKIFSSLFLLSLSNLLFANIPPEKLAELTAPLASNKEPISPGKLIALSYSKDERPYEKIPLPKGYELPSNSKLFFGNNYYGFFEAPDPEYSETGQVLALPFIGAKLPIEVLEVSGEKKTKNLLKYTSKILPPSFVPQFNLSGEFPSDQAFLLNSGKVFFEIRKDNVVSTLPLQIIYVLNRTGEVIWWHLPYIKNEEFSEEAKLNLTADQDLVISAQNSNGQFVEVQNFEKLSYLQAQVSPQPHSLESTSILPLQGLLYYARPEILSYRSIFDWNSLWNPYLIERNSLMELSFNATTPKVLWQSPGQLAADEINYISANRDKFTKKVRQGTLAISKIMHSKEENSLFFNFSNLGKIFKISLAADNKDTSEAFSENENQKLIDWSINASGKLILLLKGPEQTLQFTEENGQPIKTLPENDLTFLNQNANLVSMKSGQEASIYLEQTGWEKKLSIKANSQEALSKNIFFLNILGTTKYIAPTLKDLSETAASH